MDDLRINGIKVTVAMQKMLDNGALAYLSVHVADKMFKIYNTDESIAKLFSISQESYKERLVKNVIKHNELGYTDDPDDTYFYHRETPDYVYIDRFKEEFAEELTLIILGGNEND